MVINGQVTKNNQILLQTSDRVDGKKQRVFVHTTADAIRLAYFWNRLYIQDKLKSWLGQRVYVLNMHNETKLAITASQLRFMLINYRDISLMQLCKIVIGQEDLFHAIAPGNGSEHRPYYDKTVLSILTFCREFIAASDLCIEKTE